MRPGALPYVASALLHAVVFSALAFAAPIVEKRRTGYRVEVTVRDRRKAPPPEPPPPAPPPEPKAAPLLRPRRVNPAVMRAIEMPPPAVVPAAAPIETAPAPAEAPSFGVSMETTVEGASIAVPVGGSVMLAPESRGSPTARAPAAAAATAPAAPAVTKPPELVREVQAPYPREARDAGIEGKVILVVAIGPDGRVRRARVVKGPGHGLDEAAVAAVKQFVFRPGTVNGEPREMEIRYTYTFVLEE